MKKCSEEHLKIFKSRFKARDNVFATRWEKGSKNGYMPSYFFDPYRYRAHKLKGGTFQNFAERSFLPLTDEQIIKRLSGQHVIGIYPLLQDNMSWFIAADFDEGDWISAARKFLNACLDKGELFAHRDPTSGH